MRATEQEMFWESDFGNDYTDRNRGMNIVAANLSLFSKVLKTTGNVGSVMEFGSNIGMNLAAIRQLLPDAAIAAVEINEKAASELKKKIPEVEVNLTSILEFEPAGRKWELVFTKGVLIHINPEMLQKVYERMYHCSSRYVLVSEYYNPSPVEIEYRGHAEKLFKRDFAGELLDTYQDLQLIDYGFVYRRDRAFPLDDISWFLMEKC